MTARVRSPGEDDRAERFCGLLRAGARFEEVPDARDLLEVFRGARRGERDVEREREEPLAERARDLRGEADVRDAMQGG
ncbi:MAG: hypothetical protein L7U42_06845 [Candidatus Nanopelagicales bacterium]|nr:hypothetical protein [Candidatus Nanopelagicales bacterium]